MGVDITEFRVYVIIAYSTHKTYRKKIKIEVKRSQHHSAESLTSVSKYSRKILAAHAK